MSIVWTSLFDRNQGKRGSGIVAENKVSDKEIKTIAAYIESIKFGSVNIVIQDGRIVQIEKNEKVRLK